MADSLFITKHRALHIAVLIQLITVTFPMKECTKQVEIAEFNKIKISPFLYCKTQLETKAMNLEDKGNICQDISGRVRLDDVTILLKEKDSKSQNCQQFSKLRYNTQADGSCNPSLIEAFLGNFSRKTPNRGALDDLKLDRKAKAGQMVNFKYDCEEDANTVDMCHHNTTTFAHTSSVKLLFNAHTLGRSSNCYCYVTSAAGSVVTARALDIRLNSGNRLLFDSTELPFKPYYWWKDGEISTKFSRVSLFDVGSQQRPFMIWIKLYGGNMTIMCDDKPLDITDDNRVGPPSSSSFSEFNIVYIILIVAGAVLLLFLLFALLRCMKKQGKRHHEDLDMDEYQMAQPVSKAESKPEEENLITTQADVEYSNNTRESDDKGEAKDLNFKPRNYMKLETEIYSNSDGDNGLKDVQSPDSHFQTDAPGSQPTDTPPNLYSHFGDKPDIVPSASSNIYDATGKDDYSSLNRTPNAVASDAIYDVA